MSQQLSDYLQWLNSDRRIREMHFKTNLYLAKIRGKFSYLRQQGLSELLQFVKELREDNLRFFLRLQDVQEENACHVIFECVLNKLLGDNSPTSPTKEQVQEILIALELLQGLCLIHFPSKQVAQNNNAIEVLLDLLDHSVPSLQIAGIDALLSILVDSPQLQKMFREIKGIHRVTSLLRSRTAKKEVRSKCAEFLVFLIRYFAGEASENKKKVVAILGDRLTNLLTQSVQLNPTKEKGEKFDNFIRELDLLS